MLQNIKDNLKSLFRRPAPPAPPQTDDPVAKKTCWTPIKRGGANFRTHKLKAVSLDRVEFHTTLGMKIFCGIFILAGPVFSFFFLYGAITSEESHESTILIPILFGATFTLAGSLMLYFNSRATVFDKTLGVYYKGKKPTDEFFQQFRKKQRSFSVPLDDIYALQIISEYCRGNKSSYYSYELNLVLKDGERVNVIDHGNRRKIVEDAQTLAEFLDVPLWNAL